MHVIGKRTGGEESQGFLENQRGGNKEARVLPRGWHATHAKRVSTQVFREFAMPALHSNDLWLEREMRNTIATRNETLPNKRGFLWQLLRTAPKHLK